MPDKKIKAIIIDDEKLARDIIKKYLSSNSGIEITSECSNGFEAVKEINDKAPDLIFLDIQMPKISGFEMLELLENPPAIIFTTAFDQYAIKAFELNAIDYLLKPFSQDRFNEAVQKALDRIRDKTFAKKVADDIQRHNEKNIEYLERIVVKDRNNIFVIPVDSVEWFEAQDDYVMIHSKDGNYLKQKTMRFFEDHLNPNDFIRIHRSYIAALREIKRIELMEKDSYRVILNDDTKLSVSKNGYNKLKQCFK